MSPSCAAFIALLCAPLCAQTVHVESEPNDDKSAANVVGCLNSGDAITGTTLGLSSLPGPGSADYFRVATCALPLGIYRHRLTLTTGGSAGHLGSLRGVAQSGGVPNAGSDVAFQVSTAGAARFNAWYGFGREEELFYRVQGTPSTSASYVSTLSTTTVAPLVITPALQAGIVTISTLGQTSADTEIYLFDADLRPIPGAHNDDEAQTGMQLQSFLRRTLAPGAYFVALATFNTANDQSDASPDETTLGGNLLDFPDQLANSSASFPTNVSFTLSDGVTLVPVAATRASEFEIVWTRFTLVGNGAFAPFCFGDGADPGHVTSCPCGNNGAAGRGCANSVRPAGAALVASGSAASDDVVLDAFDMPVSAASIFLQGSGVGDSVFGDGVRCAGGTLLRMRVKVNVNGASRFPDSSDTVTLSARGGVVPGSGVRRYYQTYYRNAAPSYCPPATFNVTGGWVVDW